MASYDVIGHGYAALRRSDPRIEAHVHSALGNAATLVNVGAGTGSYEPRDRSVVAVEPSMRMIAQRPPSAAPVVQASAVALPFEDGTFEAALAILTLHHWPDWRAGVRELARVATDRVVILTCDPAFDEFWLVRDYFPEIVALDRQTMPAIADIEREIGQVSVAAVPVPHDCSDGFLGAYWRRPEAYLDARIRGAISVFSCLSGDVTGALTRLARDLESGEWKRRNARLLDVDELELGYRLLVSHRRTRASTLIR
jgi:SAM-dependent methyltransferase